MRRLSLLVFTAALTSTALAQEPERRRMQPPPDHWMTIDSLTQALTLTPAQKTSVTGPYTALNGVLRDAAERRRAIRAQMQGAGTFVPGQEPTPEMRARMDSIRTEMEGFQAEADQWLAAIRNLLTPAQRATFDTLPKPVLIRRPPRGTGPGGGMF
jgi:Spy/CpxP family protein refolding chaperone